MVDAEYYLVFENHSNKISVVRGQFDLNTLEIDYNKRVESYEYYTSVSYVSTFRTPDLITVDKEKFDINYRNNNFVVSIKDIHNDEDTIKRYGEFEGIFEPYFGEYILTD